MWFYRLSIYIYNVLGLSESMKWNERNDFGPRKKIDILSFFSRFRFRAHVPDPVFNIFKLVLI